MASRPARRLAAIVHADVVGSTALVQRDESIAHERIQDCFRRFSRIIEAYGGVTRELRGDALVAEFARASDAVSAAIAFQIENAEFNAQLDKGIQPNLRAGISLGEVIVANDTVTGAGVVVAQRLEQLAAPGGVVVQGSVAETVPARLPFEFDNLGDQLLKGFERPVRAFLARLASGAVVPDPEPNATTPAVAMEKIPEPPKLEPPDKPSIAVLPFTNLCGDPAQEPFCDGLTEDIITNLSRYRDLFVIASNSSFAYKGRAVKIQDACRELGVRYILEGSVQQSNDRVRITAQLIDGITGLHLWAERYQKQSQDLFAVQDEVTELIVGTLASGYGGRLRRAWQTQASRSKPPNSVAFDRFMRGLNAAEQFTREGNRSGRELFKEAIAIDPGYAKAYGKLAWTHIIDAIEGWSEDYQESMNEGLRIANQAIECDDGESWAHWPLAACYVYMGRHDLAQSEFRRALELNPNDADVLTDAAYYFSYSGKAAEGVDMARRAMRLNPHYPEYYAIQLVQILFDARRYAEAVDTYQGLRNIETTLGSLYLAASHAALGQDSAARNAVKRVIELDTQASIRRWTSFTMAPYRNPEDLAHFRDNLRRAGLPD